MIPDYTLVVGVDAKHLKQLALTYPTWMRHKPSLRDAPMIVFRDQEQVTDAEVHQVIDHSNLSIYCWPLGNIEYEGTPGDKWIDPQRYKMLAGFVHVPAMFVRTPYWLKLDCDVVATGTDDWIDSSWFTDKPAIVAHAWTFTKPPDQMVKLDEWSERDGVLLNLFEKPPLNLYPKPGATRLGHARIISWCGFFNTAFTRICSNLANTTCGMYKLPVASQDGFMWYVARRVGLPVKRVSMKSRGWEQWSTGYNVRKAVERVMVM